MATADAMVKPEDLQAQILERIKQNQTGTYGEGAVRQAVNEFKDLESKVKSGELDQDSYIKIADSIKQYVQPIGQASTRGSGGASALTGAGWYEIQSNFKNADIYKNARELLGRDIDAKEFAQIAPRFGTGSAKDIETGRGYLAELAQQEARSPQALAKKAPQFSGQVNEQFKSILGRDASDSERDYYGRLLATGELSPYEIEQYIKSGKEFQGMEDKKFRGELSGELGKYRGEALDKAQEQILSRQARATGPHKSSGLDFALAGAAKDLEGETERYLSSLSASQYGGNKATARADYETMLSEYLTGKKYKQGRSDAYTDYLTQRADQSVDYNTQLRDYLNFLSSQPKDRKKGAAGLLTGALTGAAAGAPMGPAGVGAGAGIGALSWLLQ